MEFGIVIGTFVTCLIVSNRVKSGFSSREKNVVGGKQTRSDGKKLIEE